MNSRNLVRLFLVVAALFSVSLAIDPDVEELLQSLTLAQKIGQMTQLDVSTILLPNSADQLNLTALQYYLENFYVGSFLNSPTSGGPVDGISCLSVPQWQNLIDTIINMSLSVGSKIPIVYGLDSVHGANYIYNSTLFPQEINAASSFNRDLVTQMGHITAKETRATGIPWVFSPIQCLTFQPIWPRVYETWGEDPYLAHEMGYAIISGLQSQPANLSAPDHLAACMKHFIGYSYPKEGEDQMPNWMHDRLLYEYFVPSFQGAVDAGVATAMEAYNEIAGVPLGSSHQYLTSLLREKMNFTGMLVTDYGVIEMLNYFHHVAANYKDATYISMKETSIDMSMVPLDTSFPTYLLQLVNEGLIPESRVDESAGRILQLKKDLGILTNPYLKSNVTVGNADHLSVALDLCRESLILLKNEGNILPFSTSLGTLLVTGPSADSLRYLAGGWTIHWQGAVSDSEFAYGTTILEGIQEIAGNTTKIIYEQGVDIYGKSTSDEFEAAINAAKASDYVVVAIGEHNYAERVGDIDDLTLPIGQIEYVEALVATGTPVVVILVEGRPRVLNNATQNVAALIHAMLPGPLGGIAIAEVLFGLTNPSAKLPYSYPATTGDYPLQYYHKYSETVNYLPLYPFGFGLSYSHFEYSNLKVTPAKIGRGENFVISVEITNHGPVPGKEAVLVYVSDIYRSVTPEVKMLKRFDKISLNVSETQTVSFNVTTDILEFVGIDLELTLESGVFNITCGPLFTYLTLDTNSSSVHSSLLNHQQHINLQSEPRQEKQLRAAKIDIPADQKLSQVASQFVDGKYFLVGVLCFVGGAMFSVFAMLGLRASHFSKSE